MRADVAGVQGGVEEGRHEGEVIVQFRDTRGWEGDWVGCVGENPRGVGQEGLEVEGAIPFGLFDEREVGCDEDCEESDGGYGAEERHCCCVALADVAGCFVC